MTFGDVLAFVALILSIAGALIATLLISVLAFPATTSRAQSWVIQKPGLCFGRGLGISIVIAFLAGILSQSHAGPVRIISGSLLTGLGVLVIIGGAGIVRMLSERMQQLGTQMPPFAALTRGAVLYVLAGFLPIFGWFLVTPVVSIIAIGAAWPALRGQQVPFLVNEGYPARNGNGSPPLFSADAPAPAANGAVAVVEPVNQGIPG